MLPEPTWKCMDHADSMTIYSLRPSPKLHRNGLTKFRDYPVLGELCVHDATTRSKITRTLRSGVDANVESARCWIPHHGLRAKCQSKTVDFVICFTCSIIRAYFESRDDDFVSTTVSSAPVTLFDKLLLEAHVTLEPRDLEHSKKLQELINFNNDA